MHRVTFKERKTYFNLMYTEIVVLLRAGDMAYGEADVCESQRTTDEIVWDVKFVLKEIMSNNSFDHICIHPLCEYI